MVDPLAVVSCQAVFVGVAGASLVVEEVSKVHAAKRLHHLFVCFLVAWSAANWIAFYLVDNLPECIPRPVARCRVNIEVACPDFARLLVSVVAQDML